MLIGKACFRDAKKQKKKKQKKKTKKKKTKKKKQKKKQTNKQKTNKQKKKKNNNNKQTNISCAFNQSNHLQFQFKFTDYTRHVRFSAITCIKKVTSFMTFYFFLLSCTFLLKKKQFADQGLCFTLRKHAYIILTPLKPHFYIVKLRFTGVYIIFLISAQKHRLWVLVRTVSARRF